MGLRDIIKEKNIINITLIADDSSYYPIVNDFNSQGYNITCVKNCSNKYLPSNENLTSHMPVNVYHYDIAYAIGTTLGLTIEEIISDE